MNSPKCVMSLLCGKSLRVRPSALGGCKRDGEKEERGSAEKESDHSEFEQHAGVVAMRQ